MTGVTNTVLSTLLYSTYKISLAANWKVTSTDGEVAMSSANGLVGTEFASQYRLQPRPAFLKAQWISIRPLHPLLSL